MLQSISKLIKNIASYRIDWISYIKYCNLGWLSHQLLLSWLRFSQNIAILKNSVESLNFWPNMYILFFKYCYAERKFLPNIAITYQIFDILTDSYQILLFWLKFLPNIAILNICHKYYYLEWNLDKYCYLDWFITKYCYLHWKFYQILLSWLKFLPNIAILTESLTKYCYLDRISYQILLSWLMPPALDLMRIWQYIWNKKIIK